MMYYVQGHAAVLFWMILVIEGQRWYSATLVGSQQSKPVHYAQAKVTRINPLPHEEPIYLPLTMVKYINQTKKEKFSFLNKYKTTPEPSIKHSNIISALSMTAQRPEKLEPFKLKPNFNTEKLDYNEAILKRNSSYRNPVFKIDKTITNVNIIRKTKPKEKYFRRCRKVKPRQKKQLNSNLFGNQTAQKRFLEVFEVVEFDHVTCTSSSGLEGICLPEFDCQSSEGAPMGSCADGYGTCCVTQFSCDDHSATALGWFTNPGFPTPSSERLSCVFTLGKASADIKQIRLDFNNFELLPPTAGSCEQDQFVISGQNVNNLIPILCGVNTGQHVYIEVGDVDGPITFSVQTVSADSRLFSFKIMQLTSSDELAAPSGCLQYFKGPLGYLESFNFRDKSDIAIARSPSYLNNLNYAMCIERAPSTCSVTYTNTGDMQIVNYDSDGLPVIPPGQAGVEIFNCPTDWLLIAAVRLCGERINDGSVLQDFGLDAPVIDVGAGPIVVWFRSDGGYVGRGFKLQFQQNNC